MVSNIIIKVNGSGAGDGFLIAPDGANTFLVPLNLSTNDGSTVNATIDATPNAANLALPGGNISIGPAGITIPIFAKAVSNARGDTVINVHVGGVTTSFSLTAISSPQIWFRGRFEDRFATDGDYYNNLRGTDGGTPGNDTSTTDGFGPYKGWTWALEGEPDFIVGNGVPITIDTAPIGRVLRFNNPISLRPFASPVATTVDEISGSTTAGTERFSTGDPIIGATVNLGPNTYLAGNSPQNPTDPQPQEHNPAGHEPMALFEFHIDGFFSGKSATANDRPITPPQQTGGFVLLGQDGATGISNPVNQASDFADAIAAGIVPPGTTQNAFYNGITNYLTTGTDPILGQFATSRLQQLQTAYNALSPANQTGTVAGRNLLRRIQHLQTNPLALPVQNVPSASLLAGWVGKEEYTGQVNDSITFQPSTSSVLSYFAGYTTFTFFSKLFSFHSDELNGFVHGSLTANTSAPRLKTCSLLIQNSTFGKDEIQSMGLPATFQSAFWVVLDGFFPSELGIDATGNLTNPANPPIVSFSVDPPANANPTVMAALQNANPAMDQMKIPPFAGPVLAQSLPPTNAPQRFLYPFNINFTDIGGFVLQSEFLTLTATITVNGQVFASSAKLELATAANPYVTDVDAGNNYTSWLSTDLRVFSVDDDELFFGAHVMDYYPAGATGISYPVSAAAASKAATGYISDVIRKLTAGGGQAGLETFDGSLSEAYNASRSQLEYLQLNPRSGKAAFSFAICRVRIRGNTPPPPPPFTTQARNCRVFFRAFQAQNAVTTFNVGTTYRETPIVPNYGTRVPLLGVETDAMGQEEYVTIPFFAVDRINLSGPADLTAQPADTPNVQTISPVTGTEVDTYYGCWLDMNQPTLLFPQFAPPGDYDNKNGTFNKTGFLIQSINNAFTRGGHQCLIAEIAFDDLPIPPSADPSTSDKLAQRNLAWIDAPNPGVNESRRMPHPFQIQASIQTTKHVDELMVTWGNTPSGSTASFYLPGVAAVEIMNLANNLYINHSLTVKDPYTIEVPTGIVTFVPIPKGVGLLAGLLTVDLPPKIERGQRYTVVVRQVTDASLVVSSRRGEKPTKQRLSSQKQGPGTLTWRRVLGAFQVNIAVSTKQLLLEPEERRLALFRSIAEHIETRNRWYPVIQRYVNQLAGRVSGFGGDPSKIPPSPSGNLPGQPGVGDHGREATGKVEGLIYDRFGDFEGFVLDVEEGHRTFRSDEHEIEELVHRAWAERIVLTVKFERDEPHRIRSIVLRGPPPESDR